MNYSKIYTRPPTKRMIEKLKDCLEKERHNEKVPCMAEEMKSSLSGLYKRGLVETRMEFIKNKRLLCIYITDIGKQFLESLSQHSFPETEDN